MPFYFYICSDLTPRCLAQVKLCITLMVMAVLEVHHGVDNLWKQGASAGICRRFFTDSLTFGLMRCTGMLMLTPSRLISSSHFLDQFNSKGTEASTPVILVVVVVMSLFLTLLFNAATKCHPPHT
jgi:hypothetical protein